MYEVSICSEFDSSHFLLDLPDDHPCKGVHWHHYVLEVFLRNKELDKSGFLADQKQIDLLNAFTSEMFDKKFINDKVKIVPTLENLTRFFYKWALTVWKDTCRVRLSDENKSVSYWE